jgi:putative transposase
MKSTGFNYVNILKDYGIAISISDKTNPYGNPKTESFFRTLKVEEVYIF